MHPSPGDAEFAFSHDVIGECSAGMETPLEGPGFEEKCTQVCVRAVEGLRMPKAGMEIHDRHGIVQMLERIPRHIPYRFTTSKQPAGNWPGKFARPPKDAGAMSDFIPVICA